MSTDSRAVGVRERWSSDRVRLATSFIEGASSESGTGLPHSTTLARWRWLVLRLPGFGLRSRWIGTAFAALVNSASSCLHRTCVGAKTAELLPPLDRGRLLFRLVAVGLMAAGLFALLQSATCQLLPHDTRYLGMDTVQLCGVRQGRVVRFMFHNRVSFGGALIAISLLYHWLEQVPLKAGEAWAWWTFLLTGLAGFGSFLAYLSYGYLDVWHGAATLVLLPVFVVGVILSWRSLNLAHERGPAERKVDRRKARVLGHSDVGNANDSPTNGSPSRARPSLRPRTGALRPNSLALGRGLLLGTGLGLVAGGTTILLIGMTRVFVPQDLRYIGLGASDLVALNRRLVPLIAHDRAGFGGAIATCGLLLFSCVWFGRSSRRLWQAVSSAGSIGFITAIGVHPLIGYTDFSHLAPAYLGALMFFSGITLCHGPMCHDQSMRHRCRKGLPMDKA